MERPVTHGHAGVTNPTNPFYHVIRSACSQDLCPIVRARRLHQIHVYCLRVTRNKEEKSYTMSAPSFPLQETRPQEQGSCRREWDQHAAQASSSNMMANRFLISAPRCSAAAVTHSFARVPKKKKCGVSRRRRVILRVCCVGRQHCCRV